MVFRPSIVHGFSGIKGIGVQVIIFSCLFVNILLERLTASLALL